MRHIVDIATPRQGHAATSNLWRYEIKPFTSAGGRGRLTWETIDLDTRAGMRKFFHGFVLPDFAAHTGIGVVAWKEWLTKKFCPPQFNEDGTEVGRKSTEAMSDTQFSDFLLEVQAFGTNEVGVVFTEQATP